MFTLKLMILYVRKCIKFSSLVHKFIVRSFAFKEKADQKISIKSDDNEAVGLLNEHDKFDQPDTKCYNYVRSRCLYI